MFLAVFTENRSAIFYYSCCTTSSTAFQV